MKKLEEQISKFQSGNFIKYWGPHKRHFDNWGQITSVVKHNEHQTTYYLKMYDFKNEPLEEIFAEEDYLRPLFLGEDHLIKLGYQKMEENSIFQYGKLTVLAYSAVRVDKMTGREELDLGSYRATDEVINSPISYEELEQIRERSIYVGEFHRFQNLMKIYYPQIEVRYW